MTQTLTKPPVGDGAQVPGVPLCASPVPVHDGGFTWRTGHGSSKDQQADRHYRKEG
mgnify:CR=1 FL=1